MERPVKVLHVTFNMAIGGTEQVIKQIIEGSINTCQHYVFCIDGEVGDIGKQLEQLGIQFFLYKRVGGLDWSLVKELKSVILNNEIDVVHCHQYTPYSYGMFASFSTSAKVMFTEHGRFYPDVYSWKRRILNPLFSLFTQKIIAISEATKDALVHYEWFPRSSIDVIYNGMAPGKYAPDDLEQLKADLNISGKRVLGTVARLDPIKNHAMMLEGFLELLKANPNVVLLIVGDGPERGQTEKRIEQLGLQDHVIMTGFRPKPAVYFGLIDIFLLPSFSEGTSMTLLEAMANGKPAVVTNVGGNPEIVAHQQTGFVCESENVDEFASYIRNLVNDKDLYDRMSRASVERYNARFTLESMSQAYEHIYKSATR